MPPPASREIKAKLQVTCQNCSLNDLCIPRGLSHKDVERVGAIVNRRKTLQKGDCLYRQGDKFRGILAIKSGTVKLLTVDTLGNEFVTGYLLPGELLGFDGLAEDLHKYSALALENVEYCEMAADELDSLCREVPNLLRELFRHASKTLNSETDRFVLSQRTAEERIVHFLLDLSDRLSRRGFSGIDIKLSLNRQEIGNYLGLAMETVSRALKNLEEMGLITVKAKLIHILDKDKLRERYPQQ
ncbi:MAG: helix-turn-helix domain-containing protein [Candidatus Methylumidiphilus sp.]